MTTTPTDDADAGGAPARRPSPPSRSAGALPDPDLAAAVTTPLAAQRFSPPAGRPVGRIVAVHGFTQTSACWAPVDADLARDHDLVLVDAPGHGASTGLALDLVTGARALVEAGGAGTYLGYSMGGRFALHAALARPDAVDRLVLVSATAGLDDPDERANRRQADERLADRILDIGVEPFIDEWLAQPLFAGLTAAQAHRRGRLANTAGGLASSLRLAGTGTQEPLWDRLGELTMPVLVVAGADDDKFVALAERLVDGIGPAATLGLVPGAGHTAHLERPDAFLARLRAWL